MHINVKISCLPNWHPKADRHVAKAIEKYLETCRAIMLPGSSRYVLNPTHKPVVSVVLEGGEGAPSVHADLADDPKVFVMNDQRDVITGIVEGCAVRLFWLVDQRLHKQGAIALPRGCSGCPMRIEVNGSPTDKTAHACRLTGRRVSPVSQFFIDPACPLRKEPKRITLKHWCDE